MVDRVADAETNEVGPGSEPEVDLGEVFAGEVWDAMDLD